MSPPGRPLESSLHDLASVGRFKDSCFGPTVDDCPNVAMSLMRGRIQNVGVVGIEDDVGDSRVGVLVDRGLFFVGKALFICTNESTGP